MQEKLQQSLESKFKSQQLKCEGKNQTQVQRKPGG
jgi:hypothetical protein